MTNDKKKIKFSQDDLFLDVKLMNFSPYYRVFSIWLIAGTVLFNLLGMISTKLAAIMSMMILLPYMVAFFIMCKRYAEEHHTVLDQKQRWRIAIMCSSLFWLYTLATNILSYLIMNGFNLQPLLEAFNHGVVLLFTLGAFLCINALISGLGYYFLGKPLQMMQKYHQG